LKQFLAEIQSLFPEPKEASKSAQLSTEGSSESEPATFCSCRKKLSDPNLVSTGARPFDAEDAEEDG
jgi:hypothetical protein